MEQFNDLRTFTTMVLGLIAGLGVLLALYGIYKDWSLRKLEEREARKR